MRWIAIFGALVMAGLATEDPPILEVGHPVERRIGGKQPHDYRLMLKTGEYASVVAEQRGIDIVLRVLGPDGKAFVESDVEGSKTGREFVGVVASSAGTY